MQEGADGSVLVARAASAPSEPTLIGARVREDPPAVSVVGRSSSRVGGQGSDHHG